LGISVTTFSKEFNQINGKAKLLIHCKISYRYLGGIIVVYPLAMVRILEPVKSKANFLIGWHFESYFI